MRSASFSMWIISSMAVRLKSIASRSKPWSSQWKWKYMYWWTAASSSATAAFSSVTLFLCIADSFGGGSLRREYDYRPPGGIKGSRFRFAAWPP